MKKILIIILILGFSYDAFSNIVVNSPIIEGIIVAYDKNTVTISQKGKRIRVPKKSIPARFKIRSGNKVYAVIKHKKRKNSSKKARQNKRQARK